jgi:hypothetical protein
MKVLRNLPVSPWFTNASSFLVSTICHMVAMIVLALISLTPEQEEQIQVVEFVPDSDASEQLLLTPQVETTLPPPQVLELMRIGEVAMQSQPVGELPTPQSHENLDLHSFTVPDTQRYMLGMPQYADAMRPTPLSRKFSASTPVQASSPTINLPDLRSDPYIEVVRRFIQYDIGQLRGEEGAQARRDFSALGEDAIPALVWGLNQSAYLNQSCPVIVIQSKLNEELSASGDPQQLRYAQDNVGKGVPDNAPYAQRLRSFQRGLGQTAGGAGNSRSKQTAAAQQRERIRSLHVRRLARTPGKLRERLADDDANIRWAAARLTASRGLPFVNELAGLLDDSDADVRHEAHEALLRISRGEDYGPFNDADSQDRQEAVQCWRDWWVYAQQERKESIDRHQVSDNAEEIANSALQMAQSLERLGRQQAADRRYRDITVRFPETAAADVARGRLAR